MLVKYNNVKLNVHKSQDHEWMLETSLVAKGYETDVRLIRQALIRRRDDLIEGKHWVKGGSKSLSPSKKNLQPNQIFWTKKGVIALGFFLRCEKAREFRSWAEDLILSKNDKKLGSAGKVALQEMQGLCAQLIKENEVLNEKVLTQGYEISDLTQQNKYWTVNDFARLMKRPLTLTQRQSIGIKATELTIEECGDYKVVVNGNYQKIHAYKIHILNRAMFDVLKY